jgi:hypothetical protein
MVRHEVRVYIPYDPVKVIQIDDLGALRWVTCPSYINFIMASIMHQEYYLDYVKAL